MNKRLIYHIKSLNKILSTPTPQWFILTNTHMVAGLKKMLIKADYIFCVFSAILFTFGSSGIFNDYIIPLSIASIFFLIGLWLIKGKHLSFPKYLLVYLIFMAIMLIHNLLNDGSLFYSLLFLSAGLYWFIFHNLQILKLQNRFFIFLMFYGLLMAGLFIGFIFYGTNSLDNNSLFLPLYNTTLHNHLGDIWAVIEVGVIYSIIEKKEKWHIPLLIFGALLILQSFSRSALVSLGAGIAYIYYRREDRDNLNRFLLYATIGLSVMFVVLGFAKTTIFSRPYIGEAFSSLISSPLGIGMGKFADISSSTSIAHNIVLEFTTGMGVFSFLFVYWLIKIVKIIFTKKGSVLYGAIFLAILTNFLFDTTYVIPAMIWFWFSSLALVFTDKS